MHPSIHPDNLYSLLRFDCFFLFISEEVKEKVETDATDNDEEDGNAAGEESLLDENVARASSSQTSNHLKLRESDLKHLGAILSGSGKIQPADYKW